MAHFILSFIGAGALVFGCAYWSFCLSFRCFRKFSAATRWCAAFVIGLYTASLFGHLLLASGQFNLWGALFANSALLLIAQFWRVDVVNQFRSDLTRLWRLLSFPANVRTVQVGFTALLVLIVIRACLLPPLEWDAITYHAVKSGLWVQGGAKYNLDAPGGWSAYRTYFGGGSLLNAWTLLPFRSDFLSGIAQVVQWLGIALAAYGLGKVLCIRQRFRWAIVLSIVSLPTLFRYVGSGLIEPVLALCALSGLFFGTLYLKALSKTKQSQRAGGGPLLLITLMSFGLACGIKITMLPMMGAVCFLLLLFTLVRFNGRSLIWFALGGLAAASMIFPWLLYSYEQTGYPLSPMPIKIGSWVLGQSNPVIDWYQMRPDLNAYDWGKEWNAFVDCFRSPFFTFPHLSWSSFLLLLLSPLGFIQLFRRSVWIGVLFVVFCSMVLVSFYHPGFSTVRLTWGFSNSRFLIALFMALTFLPFIDHRNTSTLILSWVLLLFSAIHLSAAIVPGWGRVEEVGIPLSVLAIFALLIIFRMGWPKLSRFVRPVLLGLVLFLCVWGLYFFRSKTRYLALSGSRVAFPVQNYWAGMAQSLDTPGQPRKIAFTSGPLQNSDNWFLYYFLGSQFQNEIDYVPITTSGNIVHFGPTKERSALKDFDAWHQRLKDRKITNVVSYYPTSIEYQWMKQRPDLFDPIIGDGKSWGLYAVKQ